MKKILLVAVIIFMSCSNDGKESAQNCGYVKSVVYRIKSDGSQYVSAVDFGNGYIQLTKNNPETISKGTYFCVE